MQSAAGERRNHCGGAAMGADPADPTLMMVLEPFEPILASVVSPWARTQDEVLAWCARGDVPVPHGVIAGWPVEPGISAYGLSDGTELVGYGELWIDDEESEVELARLIVAPDRRGRGIGRHLARTLAQRARAIYP